MQDDTTTTARALWDKPTLHPEMHMLDVSGVGRYLVRREERGSRVWRAFLNGTRTTFAGPLDDVKAMVERAVRAKIGGAQ